MARRLQRRQRRDQSNERRGLMADSDLERDEHRKLRQRGLLEGRHARYLPSNWPGRSQYIRFRAIDHFSDARPNWMSSAQAAVSAWNSAPGPQLYSFTPQTNDTWVYSKDAAANDDHLPPRLRRGYMELPTKRAMQQTDRARGVYIAHRTDIYFNRDSLPNTSNSLVTFGCHESGHAMLLTTTTLTQLH